MTSREKFLTLVDGEATDTLIEHKWRIANRDWLRQSQRIALKILLRLEDLNWTQKMLAEKMGVSPQQINKIVKGRENLSLDTLTKLQTILEVPILASYSDMQQADNMTFHTQQILETNETHVQLIHHQYANVPFVTTARQDENKRTLKKAI